MTGSTPADRIHTAPDTPCVPGMHTPSTEDADTLLAIARWADERLTGRRGPLGAPSHKAVLPPIAQRGIGSAAAWAVLRDEILPTTVPADHPGYLSFIPGSPTVAAVAADMAVSASAVYAGSELEAGAVVRAERATLRWLADLIGLPPSAHGAFVSGGSIANLSALVAARDRHRHSVPGRFRPVGERSPLPDLVVAAASAHSSITAAAEIMGCDVVLAGHEGTPLSGADVRRHLAELPPQRVVAVATTAGATNDGSIDDLDDIAQACQEHGAWLHVDAAYGGAALLIDTLRPLMRGIERADSVIIDPHKWLFTPFDCAAVLYRDSALARRTHAQRAPYLEAVIGGDNPSDYATELTRRARGLPLWTSLIANGTQAYADAVAQCLHLAGIAVERVQESTHLELVVEPSLSVVLLRRTGWTAGDYQRWSHQALRTGLGLVTPTRYRGAACLRLCFVNPLTTESDIYDVLASLR